jgi:hypothetical protein
MPIHNFDSKTMTNYYIIVGISYETNGNIAKKITEISNKIYFFNFGIYSVKKPKIFGVELDRQKNQKKKEIIENAKKIIVPAIVESDYNTVSKNIKCCKCFIFYHKNIAKNCKELGIRMVFNSYYPVLFNNIL